MPITVIIAAWESGPALRVLLDSVRNQELPPAEVLVVDRGTSGVAHEQVAGMPGARVLMAGHDDLDQRRRQAIEAARHALVAFAEPGCLWPPGHLALLASVLDRSPETAAAFVELSRSGDSARREPVVPEFEPVDPWATFPLNPVATPAQVLFRRQVLLDQGGWSVRYPGVADFQAWLTLSARRPLIRVSGPRLTREVAAPSAAALQRRRNRWEFCDRYLTAAQDRVSLRLRYHPADAVPVRTRLRVARHLFAWRFADAQLGPAQSAPMALQVDALLANEPRPVQQRLLELAFLFFPADEHPARFRKAVGLIRVWRRCPREAHHLRLALRQYIQRRVSGSLQPTG